MNNDSTQSKLEQVIAQYLDAVDSGTPTNRKSLIAAHPDLAPELQSFFVNHDMLCAIRLSQSSIEPQPETDLAHATTTGFDTQTRGHIPSFDDYELIDEIARGGMGVVYKARQKSLNRIVALKMIKSGEFANQEQVDRFYKEAEAAANLDHPGIVPVHEVGEVDGEHYFTMGFVDGESLADRLRDGPLPPKEAARYAKSIADAVAFAHSKGVIHRDLKPGNVLITAEGQIRITDFGLAKRIEEDNELTSTGQVLGTPSYMPPEQAEGKLNEIGPAADIYAIGASLYCMLVGRPPFQAANVVETLRQVLDSDPVSLSSQNKSVPADLETLCLKCLEKRPTSRYRSTVELAAELDRFINAEPIRARPIGTIERAVRWCTRKPIHATALSAVIILAVAGPTLWIQLLLSNRDAAVSKVDTLLNASPETIPLVLSELDSQARTVRSRLLELDAEDLSPQQRIRVSLALLPYATKHRDMLKQRLYDCTYDELAVLLERLRVHGGDTLVSELWAKFRNNQLPKNEKFRTGLALAALSPASDRWQSEDFEFLVASMLAQNSLYQPAIRRSLLPVADRLMPALKSAFETVEPDTLADEASANAMVAFAANDAALLTQLSSFATPRQHLVVFERIAAMSESKKSIVDQLAIVTIQSPKRSDDQARRIRLGKRRAGAAITLMRLGEFEAGLKALRIVDDPEALTHFVHGCKKRNVAVEGLLNMLNHATRTSERYGILLALGEFDLRDMSEDIRPNWIDYIKNMYANDPSSGLHGASGWLLREWGLIEEARAIEQRDVPYSKDREWFTLKINLAAPLESEKHSYFTFVVFQAGEYIIGSADYELDRHRWETRHTVVFSRDFAVLDREITRGEYESYRRHIPAQIYAKSLDSAMVGTNWYNAVLFCRWLTKQWGKSESDQYYADPTTLSKQTYPVDPDPAAEGMPMNWPVDSAQPGFRLPTESEWEAACRAGMATRFSFGCDESLLSYYGWHLQNSKRQSHRGSELRPNLKGVFDMVGNVDEWCHDWWGKFPAEIEVDPQGNKSGRSRISRGGSWSSMTDACRASERGYYQPFNTGANIGFRLSLVVQEDTSRGK